LAQSEEELSKEVANPLADLISFPIQNNLDTGLGDFDRSRNVLNIQPVVPFSNGRIITRTIVPFVWIPDISSESESFSSGLSDIQATVFFAPEREGATIGYGAVLEVPTGGSARGSEKWSLGPSVVALVAPGDWTLGLLANNIWSIAGDADRADVNKGLAQYFIVRQLGSGWYVNSAPIITVNWKAPEGQRWIVPFGLGAGKLHFFGRLPINAQVGAYYNAVKPDIGPDWQFRFQVQFVFPKG
jgi:hypothetical protein